MKNLLFLLLLVALAISFNACKGKDDNAWKDANTDAYNAITKNTEYRALQTATGPTGVYYKVINSGTGTVYPLQTSKVKVLYKGTYYNKTVFDAGTSGNDIPAIFGVNGSIYSGTTPLVSISRGLSFVLQNMVVGDKWEIWIPYYLGYGSGDYYTISNYQLYAKAYSTLIFEVELVSITQYP